MFNPERLLGQMISGGLGFGGRRSRNASRAAVGIGLLGIAVAAYEHYNQSSKSSAAPITPPSAPPPAPAGRGSLPPPPPPASDTGQREADALLMLRAMISAAHADGRIDDDERQGILARANEAGLDAEDITALERELATPWPLAALVATTQPAMRERVYLAARMAIDPDHPAELRFLDELAAGIRLDAERRGELEQQLASADQ